MALLTSASSKLYSGFSPTSIPGCTLWLDGQDSNTLTLSGSNVSQWNDKSGNGYSAAGSVAPTYNATTKYLVFGGNASGQYMTVSDGAYPTGNNPYSIFIVSYTNDITAQQWIVAGGVRTTNQGLGVLYLTTAAIWVGWWGGEYKLENVTTNGVPHIINATYSASLRRTYFNGGSNLSNNPGATRNTPTTPNYIGTILDPRSGAFLDGGVGEIIMYNSDLTDFQRRQVEGYLATKWNLDTRLPVAHPYKAYQFSPLEIPGCSFWVDAADLTTLTLSGSNVTQWTDKSGSNVTLTASGTPTRGTYNGLSVVQFNGSGGGGPYLQNAGFTNSGPYAIFYAMKFNGFANLEWQTLTDNASGLRPFVGYDGTAQLRASLRFGGSPTTNPEIWSLQYSSNDVTVFNVNGTDVRGASTGYGGVGHTSGLRVGLAGNAGAGLNGWIGEIIIFSGTLSTIQIQRIESYLSTKWGITGSNLTSLSKIPAPVFTRPFIPLDISGCAVWVDAQDTKTLTISNTSNVAIWGDKSGNGYNFSNDTTTMWPVYVSNGINGYPSLQFTGISGSSSSNSRLDNSNVVLNNNYSIFAVGKQNASAPSWTGYNYLVRAPLPGDWGIAFGAHPSRNFTTFAGTGGGWHDVNSNSPGITLSNVTRILGMKVSSGTMTPYYDGYTMSNKTGTNRALTGMQIADTSPLASNGQNWNGQIGEIVVYNQTIADSDRQMLEGYLAWKWGKQTDLSTSHPYRLYRPLVPAFTPLQIPRCILWLDAADRSTLILSNTSNVSNWTNKANTLSNFTVGGGASNVVYSVTNGVQFLNTSNSGAGYMVGNPGFDSSLTVVTVMTPLAMSSGTYSFLWSWRWNNGGDRVPGVRVTNSAGGFEPYITWVGNNGISLPLTLGNRYILMTEFASSAGGTVAYSSNGTTPATGTIAASTITPSAFFLGGDGGSGGVPSEFGRFYLSEMLIYAQRLSSSQRQQVEGYLAAKWGMRADLSSSHPYKVITP
jgi:hypothetical protein